MGVWQGRSGPAGGPVGWQGRPAAGSSPAAGLPWKQAGPRPTILSGCIAAAELIGLAFAFSLFGLHGGLFAIPAFLPLLLWTFCCAVAGRTLRPSLVSRLHGGWRGAAVLALLVVFLLVWSSWSAAALAAWHGHHGGFTTGGSGGSFGAAVPSLNGFPAGGGGGGDGLSLPSLPDPFPSLPYGSVLGASPVLLGVVWLMLLGLGMLAMPGRRRVRTLPPAGQPVGQAADAEPWR